MSGGDRGTLPVDCGACRGDDTAELRCLLSCEREAWAAECREPLLAVTAPTEPTVEIGGQVMTQAQFDAARYPLLNPDPGPVDVRLGDEMSVTFGPEHDHKALAMLAHVPNDGWQSDEQRDLWIANGWVTRGEGSTDRRRALTDAWQAVDRAIRPLGHGGGASNSPWNEGYERAKNEALDAIRALLAAAPAPTDQEADRG